MLKDIYLLKMIACISVRVLVRPQRQYIDSLYDAEAKLRELTSFLFDARYQPIFPLCIIKTGKRISRCFYIIDSRRDFMKLCVEVVPLSIGERLAHTWHQKGMKLAP